MARNASLEARKRDTREKIELGGLIVKAGLRYEKRALLFAALVELKEKLSDDDKERARLISKGADAFRHNDD